MVKSKATEYQHAYRGGDDQARADYLDNVDYVQKRRLLESHHVQSPFDWDVHGSTDLPSDESGKEDENEEVEQITTKLREKVQLVPDKCSPKRTQPAIRKVASVGGFPHAVKNLSKGVQVDLSGPPQTPTPPRSKSATPSASSYFRSFRPFVNDLPPVRRSNIVNTGKCYHIHEHSPPEEELMFDGALKPTEFSPYALGNKARRVSGKRTYNVRADHGVFSTALRASAKRTASLAYNPPSSAPYGSPPHVHCPSRRGFPCPYDDCRCSKNYDSC